MKNTILKTLTAVLVLAVFSVYFAPEKKIEKKISLDPTIKIINFTPYKNLDSIVNITAQILQIKKALIVCVAMSEEEAINYFAYVEDKDGYYLININPKLTDDLLIESIVHEMVHVQQSYSGRLKTLSYGFWFEGLTYTFKYPYFSRPFEEEAYRLEFSLKYAVKNLM
jgi:hypothetical protein